jgi:hypothetical protein
VGSRKKTCVFGRMRPLLDTILDGSIFWQPSLKKLYSIKIEASHVLNFSHWAHLNFAMCNATSRCTPISGDIEKICAQNFTSFSE